jgi:Cu(I)/Ag(I) efflux system membrane fusion protein
MKLNRSTLITVGFTLLIGVAAGAMFFGGSSSTELDTEHAYELNADGLWTCSMHPQVRLSEPGACPFCGMDLIPVSNDEGGDPAVMKMSNAAIQLANIQTAIVGSGSVDDVLRLSGKIKVDERRVKVQTTHFAGRVDALYKSFEGDLIKKGEKIASIYSPELVAAQEELIEAKKLEDTNPILLAAARRKLHHWKLTMEQINEIETSNAPVGNFDLLAEYDGIISKKLINTGNYLPEGGGIMEITDLSKVWAVFEVYEKDLGKIRLGDRLKFENKATSKPQEGTVSFISPAVDQQTRIVEVRADLNNSLGSLKPGMFISTSIFSSSEAGIIIPKSAVLWTGKRSIVYVKSSNERSFELREVVLGEAVNNQYVIESGLKEGEEVVVNGAFTLDAEAQLRGKISMMNPTGGASATGHNHGEQSMNSSNEASPENPFYVVELTDSKDYKNQVDPKFQEQLMNLSMKYIALKDLMVEGNGSSIRKEGIKVKTTLNQVDMSLVKGEAHLHWMSLLKPMTESLETITTSGDRDIQRLQFINLSKALINAVQSFGTSFDSPLYVQYCPMANNNQGATWISKEENIVNPYFGDVMLTCGNVESIIKGN